MKDAPEHGTRFTSGDALAAVFGAFCLVLVFVSVGAVAVLGPAAGASVEAVTEETGLEEATVELLVEQLTGSGPDLSARLKAAEAEAVQAKKTADKAWAKLEKVMAVDPLDDPSLLSTQLAEVQKVLQLERAAHVATQTVLSLNKDQLRTCDRGHRLALEASTLVDSGYRVYLNGDAALLAKLRSLANEDTPHSAVYVCRQPAQGDSLEMGGKSVPAWMSQDQDR